MLDGRVLGASQVEYKPFGKPPLKREIQHKWHQFNTSATCATCVHIPAAPPAWQRSPALKPRQAAEPPLSPGSLLYALNFNMSEYMSDEHVLGTPGAPPCRACPASEPAPRSGFFLPRSGFRLRSTPRSVFRLRFSFRFCPKNPPEAMRWGAHRFRSWVSSRKPHCRASAEGDAVLAVSLTECFFTTHTPCRQSWRGRRIAPLNPGVATLNPGVGTGLPRCFPENAGSAVLYSTTPPDSPPGLRGKHRQCVGTHRCTPGLAARIARKTPPASLCSSALTDSPPGFPASNFGTLGAA